MNNIHRFPPLNPTLPRFLAAAILAGSILTVCNVHAQQIGDVFYIDMENHNWTQPNGNITLPGQSAGQLSIIQQIKGNSAAPFINSLVTPNIAASAQVSYASKYFNVLSTAGGSNPSIHPSEPNYIWQEAGDNYAVASDADPGMGTSNLGTNSLPTSVQSISNLLQTHSQTWKAYAEESSLGSNAGIVPIHSTSGNTVAANPYNGSTQFNYAPKHVGQLFFQNTNSNANNLANYAEVSQLQTDLNNNTVAKYNLITPDQFNDMHTALTGGFTYTATAANHGLGTNIHYTGDSAQIAQGDNFLATVVPLIEASAAYQNNGAIVIWNDEVEPQNSSDTSYNDQTHTSMEIVISPLAKGNAYTNNITYDHTSDVRTLQEVFGVGPAQGVAFLGQAATDPAGQNDLADLFQPGVVQTVPEPSTYGSLIFGALSLLSARFRHRRNA